MLGHANDVGCSYAVGNRQLHISTLEPLRKIWLPECDRTNGLTHKQTILQIASLRITEWQVLRMEARSRRGNHYGMQSRPLELYLQPL